MKNAKYFILLITIFLFTGCSKDNPVENNSNDISGDWELVAISGGISGATTIPAQNDLKYLQFTKDGRYSECHYNGQIITKCNYEIQSRINITSDRPTNCLILFDSLQTKFVYVITELTGTDLTLSENMYDGYCYHYKRVLHVTR